MTVKERLGRIKEEFAGAASSKDRLEVVLGYGERSRQARREEFSEEDKVPGCASDAYLKASLRKGGVLLETYASSLVIAGYAAILTEALQGSTPREILNARRDVEAFIKSTGLDVSLVPSRTNSFSRLYAFIEQKVEKMIAGP
ncbi:SufE family protein [Candidatus Woesearchaeota archaeon]|nr:SufE family protein [Candidatus Woesearchaeota archaeon]